MFLSMKSRKMVANIALDLFPYIRLVWFCPYNLFIPIVKGALKSCLLHVISLDDICLFRTYIWVINLNLPLKNIAVLPESFIGHK